MEDKFLKFLGSLKNNQNKSLIEAIQQGFQCLFEFDFSEQILEYEILTYKDALKAYKQSKDKNYRKKIMMLAKKRFPDEFKINHFIKIKIPTQNRVPKELERMVREYHNSDNPYQYRMNIKEKAEEHPLYKEEMFPAIPKPKLGRPRIVRPKLPVKTKRIIPTLLPMEPKTDYDKAKQKYKHMVRTFANEPDSSKKSYMKLITEKEFKDYDFFNLQDFRYGYNKLHPLDFSRKMFYRRPQPTPKIAQKVA